MLFVLFHKLYLLFVFCLVLVVFCALFMVLSFGLFLVAGALFMLFLVLMVPYMPFLVLIVLYVFYVVLLLLPCVVSCCSVHRPVLCGVVPCLPYLANIQKKIRMSTTISPLYLPRFNESCPVSFSPLLSILLIAHYSLPLGCLAYCYHHPSFSHSIHNFQTSLCIMR